MSLLNMALQEQQQALGGEENASKFTAGQFEQGETSREQGRNAGLQLGAVVGGALYKKLLERQKGQSVEQDMEDAAASDPRDAAAMQGRNSSTGGLSSLFGWVGKSVIGGFFGGSGGAPGGGS